MEETKIRMSAPELNRELRERFQIFEGPPKAYFELPYRYGDTNMLYRRAYITVCLRGQEAQSAQFILDRLIAIAYPFDTYSQHDDNNCAIFIRRWFDYNPAEELLSGRLVFWDQELNKKLQAESIFRREYEYGQAS